MSKFLEICEMADPRYSDDPTLVLLDFLRSKGIKASLVRDTDMIYIDTGDRNIAISVSDTEEDSQEGTMINDLAEDPTLPPNIVQGAKNIKKMRAQMAPKVLDAAQKKLKEMEANLRTK